MENTPTTIDIPAEPPTPPPPPRRRWDDALHDWWAPKWRKLRGPFWVCFFVALFLIVWLWDLIFVNIYPGNSGVIWRRFTGGTDFTRVYEGGLWVVNPFNKMYIYETRMQQRDTNFTALSSNGLIITIHASVRFRPQKRDLPRLHEELGPDYVDRVVLPQVQSVIRKIIGAYEPDQIYGTQGNILQNIVLTAMAELRARYIELDDLLIREILLPEKVANAIQNKLEQEQVALQFDYVLAREKKEAERKQIEAGGIRDFQRTVSADLTENYLRFRGIEASLELSKSPNAKVVVFGNTPNGLPLIFNTGDSLTAAPIAQSSPASSLAKSTPMPAPVTGVSPVVGPPAPSAPPVMGPAINPPGSKAPAGAASPTVAVPAPAETRPPAAPGAPATPSR